MNIVNGPLKAAVELRPGDYWVALNFVREITEVEYLPVRHEVRISSNYITAHGQSSDVHTVSAHELCKTVILTEGDVEL
ncbi:hypothetical protein PBI_CHE12_92 [Mycobacterium phage Che12]|uniref:Uncharacterized protein n=1 Tax=Mycobacterium phage Che12 TaxID=2911435 RepID=Q1A0C5_9CAUD|nr:gp92 [Mycobacterium phage Che12]ABE67411.1 hypothetical protein PBI_CHE12_92 [Mycobacterium phage Che12]